MRRCQGKVDRAGAPVRAPTSTQGAWHFGMEAVAFDVQLTYDGRHTAHSTLQGSRRRTRGIWSLGGTVQRDCNYAPRGPSWLAHPVSLYSCTSVRGGVLAERHSFQTHYQSCPRHQRVACPQALQAARGLKAGELHVSWQRIANPQDSPDPLGQPAVTVIVDGGGEAVVGTAPVAATGVLLDTVPRGRDLDIAAAVTRQGHVISEVCRLQLRSTQTRTGARTPSQVSSVPTPRAPAPTPLPTTVPPPTTTQLLAVADLAAAPTSHSSMELTWTPPASTDGLANLQLQRCDGAGCTGGTDIARPSATDRTHTVTSGLTRDREYYFRIRAVATQNSGYENSDWSTASGRTAKQPLPVVAGLTAAAGDPAYSRMELTWTPPASTDGRAEFGLEWCRDANCGTPAGTDTASATAASYTVTTGLVRNIEYHFRIQAIATQGSGYANSEWSTVSERTAKQPLPALTSVGPGTTTTPDQAVIEWASFTHTALASFEAAVCPDTTCSSPTSTHLITSTMATSWSHSCMGGSECLWQVRAKATSSSDYADGPWSDVITVTGYQGN